VDEPLAELAVYFRSRAAVQDQELIRLTAAARTGGSRWDAIAAACGVRDDRDITGVISPAMWKGTGTAAELLFGAAQNSLHKLTGSRSYFPPLRWHCPGCGQQVTDRAPAGRSMSSTATHRAASGWRPIRLPTMNSAASGWRG
jgi:hypothetical protein